VIGSDLASFSNRITKSTIDRLLLPVLKLSSNIFHELSVLALPYNNLGDDGGVALAGELL
jgi:hypothetical protein